jgi:DNA-binding NarL/FixJ family response regulator
MSIRVVLADDQAVVRAGFRTILEAEADIAVVGEAADGEGAVADGQGLVAPRVTRRLIAEFARSSPSLPTPAELGELTNRELAILGLIARGLSNAEIGRELFVSPSTVKTHIGNLLGKLGCRDRVQAVIYAYEHGVVRPGDQA